eukprot:5803538-Pyramimonas_sp.AAC.1
MQWEDTQNTPGPTYLKRCAASLQIDGRNVRPTCVLYRAAKAVRHCRSRPRLHRDTWSLQHRA